MEATKIQFLLTLPHCKSIPSLASFNIYGIHCNCLLTYLYPSNRSVVLTREWFLPTRLSRGRLETSKHILGCHNWWWKGLLRTSSRQRPGVLLNIPQFKSQHPTAKSYPAQNISSALDCIFTFVLSYNESKESASRSVVSGSSWPLACQDSLSMKFSRQEYWNG